MISVLLPYRNAATTLTEAVASVLADMEDEDELILVDDGSTDHPPASNDRRIVHLRATGEGLAGALNIGLAHARSPYVARMDADDVSLRGRLALQRAFLDAHPSVGAVGTRVELFGSPGEGMQRYVEWQNALLTPDEHANAIFVESPLCHPSTMIRRAAFRTYEQGPFPEDYELWLRLLADGWQLAKLPEVLFRWRMHANNLTWRVSLDDMRRLRARHLAKRLATRPFAIWGAGPAGRRLARELETHAHHPQFFIDIDPKKIGRTRRGVPVLDPDTGVPRAHPPLLLIVAVAARGARDLIRSHLTARGLIEGTHFLCAQ